ncbi:hypothetical protein H4Q26_006286 [Puccinia striiformis f. sp. tritici PST-130]|nr:hypothetical protein H4Q26_006286 [Puccinia striiformis f. sp. tritici PST-130]
MCSQTTKAKAEGKGRGKDKKCERCQVLKKACERPVKIDSKVRKTVYTNPETGSTYGCPYPTAPLAPSQTPSNQSMVNAEEDVAAPWVNREDLSKTNTAPDRLLEDAEDEETLSEEQQMQRAQREAELQEFGDHKEYITAPVPTRKIRVIIQSLPDVDEELMAAQRIKTNLKDLSGGFFGTDDQGKNEDRENDFVPNDQTLAEQSLGNRVVEVKNRVDKMEERIEDVEDQIENADQASNNVLQRVKDKVKTLMSLIAEGTAKAIAKLMQLISKSSKAKAEEVKENLRNLIDNEIESNNLFLEEHL